MNTAAAIPAHLVAATGISKSYSNVRALAPLDLTIQKGERVALAGPSGSGMKEKSSLMAAHCGG